MIEAISVNEVERWDNVVRSFKEFDVYYLNEYVRAFQIHGDGEPILIYFEDGTNRAMNVVMKRDISENENLRQILDKGEYFDFSTPYGYGGFLFEGSDTEQLELEYYNYGIDNNIVSEFVRFHPILNNNGRLRNIYQVQKLGKTVAIELKSKSLVWDSFTSKNRNMIRKAQKSGVRIFWGRSPQLYTSFISMYNATMDKDKAENYYYFKRPFYESLLNDLKYNSLMFYAVYNNEIVAMSFILYANQQMHYHLSASNQDYRSLAPTNLLLYEAACWGCDNGFKTFHLGGGVGSQEDSLYKFKIAFNKISKNTFSIGRKIFNQAMYDELVLLRTEVGELDRKSSFFPLYRA